MKVVEANERANKKDRQNFLFVIGLEGSKGVSEALANSAIEKQGKVKIDLYEN